MLYGVHLWLCLFITVAASRPGDMSSFFLKAPKSVPRAGRAAPGNYEGFFVKTTKSVPRIGRRNGLQSIEHGDLQKNDFYRQLQSSVDSNNNPYYPKKDEIYLNEFRNKEYQNSYLGRPFKDDEFTFKKPTEDNESIDTNYYRPNWDENSVEALNEINDFDGEIFKDPRNDRFYQLYKEYS